ncbi:MAG: sigma-70 family RNA polymerase sigma factor [Candidatus Limnocylindrales bacterium]
MTTLQVDGATADAAAFQRIAAGDSEGVAGLYDRHSAMVFGLALRVTNDQGLAEDVVQETFVSVWQSAESFDPAKASARTWILTIAHRRAVDAVRRRRQPVLSLDINVEEPPLRLVPVAPDVWPEVSARLDGAAIQLALAELPIAQRRSLELAYFNGLTQLEIAAFTGAALGTVKSRVRLGMLGLRKLLSSIETEQEAIGVAD